MNIFKNITLILSIALFTSFCSGKEAQEIKSMQEFREALTGRQPVVIMFYAPWCGACKSMKESYNNLATQFDSQAKIIKVNADDDTFKEAVDYFGVEAIPTFLVKHVGVMTSDHLNAAVKAFIGSVPTKQPVKSVAPPKQLTKQPKQSQKSVKRPAPMPNKTIKKQSPPKKKLKK